MLVKAYAKLNLTLDILGRRPDGYHDLRMVMQSVDLADLLAINPAEGAGRMSTNLSYLPADGRNLAQLAAAAFTAALHLWKGNTLLSITGGTACYMLLLRLLG